VRALVQQCVFTVSHAATWAATAFAHSQVTVGQSSTCAQGWLHELFARELCCRAVAGAAIASS